MVRFGLCLALWIAAVLLPASAAPRASSSELWKAGERLYEAGDYASAVQYIAPAAQQGDVRAEMLLASMYENGQGVERDRRQAGYWYRLAAAQGDNGAVYMLGTMYSEGAGGVPHAPAVAARLFRVSAERGYAPAAVALAVSYELGVGVPRSRNAALTWLERARDEGALGASELAASLRRPDAPQFKSSAQLASFAMRNSREPDRTYLACISLRHGNFRTCQ
jgi:TPR repeat protein